MSDFIAKKREMFLVQMSLDTKEETGTGRESTNEGAALRRVS